MTDPFDKLGTYYTNILAAIASGDMDRAKLEAGLGRDLCNRLAPVKPGKGKA